jgi:hypothetical protein
MYARRYFNLLGRARTFIRNSMVALLLIALSASAFAYTSGAKYWGTLTINYYINPVVDTALFSGASTLIQTGAEKWNTMRVNFVRTFDSSHPNKVTATNFASSPPPCLPAYLSSSKYAVNCVYASPQSITRNEIYYNSNSSHWIFTNTSPPDVNCSVTPHHMDMIMGGAHEFGHSLLLHDDPSGHTEAMMYNTCTTKRELQEDDKHGATMLYGVRTGWEPGFADGQLSRIAPNLALNVSGYYPGLNPELGPVLGEFGVPTYGSKYERLAGRSTSSYSYVYLTLFTHEDDTGVDQNWLTVKPGMHLKWLQFNYQQSTVSMDLRLRDPYGNTRYVRDDSRIVDQSGVRMHPAARGNYPTGQWLFFDVDLSALGYEDLRIDRWMLAYDNGNNGYIGQFRTYLDNLRIEY